MSSDKTRSSAGKLSSYIILCKLKSGKNAYRRWDAEEIHGTSQTPKADKSQSRRPVFCRIHWLDELAVVG